MNTSLVLKGMLKGMADMGIKIDKLSEEERIMYVTVDGEGELKGKIPEAMERIQESFRKLGLENFKVKYKII